jgi:hypothetical protein
MLSDLNEVKKSFRYNPDLEIAGFHLMGEVKPLQFLCCERESLNLGKNL